MYPITDCHCFISGNSNFFNNIKILYQNMECCPNNISLITYNSLSNVTVIINTSHIRSQAKCNCLILQIHTSSCKPMYMLVSITIRKLLMDAATRKWEENFTINYGMSKYAKIKNP